MAAKFSFDALEKAIGGPRPAHWQKKPKESLPSSRVRAGGKLAPTDEMIAEKRREREHMKRLAEKWARQRNTMARDYPELRKWEEVLEAEKDADMVRAGEVDWDFLTAAKECGISVKTTPENVRREAVKMFKEYVDRIWQERFPGVIVWPPGLGGYLLDWEILRRHLKLR